MKEEHPTKPEQLYFPWPTRFVFGLGKYSIQIPLSFSWGSKPEYRIDYQTELRVETTN